MSGQDLRYQGERFKVFCIRAGADFWNGRKFGWVYNARLYGSVDEAQRVIDACHLDALAQRRGDKLLIVDCTLHHGAAAPAPPKESWLQSIGEAMRAAQ